VNVELPNGVVIEDIPEGTPKDVIIQRAISSGLITEAEFGTVSDSNAPDVGLAEPSGVKPDVGEAGATFLSGMIAEPIAGLAGLASAPFVGADQASRNIKYVREALTYQPRTKGGEKALGIAADALAPVSEFMAKVGPALGDPVFEATGSPALATLAATAPHALIEILGAKGAGKFAIGFKRAKSTASKGKIARAITDAAPSIDQLKDTASAVYKEIDNLGVSLKPKTYTELFKKLETKARRMGIDPDVTPKAQKALERFADRVGDSPSLSDVDIMRKIAQNAASSIDGSEKAIGTMMVQTVDDFLDGVSEAKLRIPQGVTAEIGKRYKIARDLWGRAKRSEILEEAFDKARRQASGFENGLRRQFNQILNNKRKKRFFKPDEIKAMERVVTGTKKENIAKLIGKLGFSEGSATQLIGGTIGVGTGAYFGGPAGAVAVPLVGQVSKKLAQRMTAKNAEFADQVIRAGKDANRIAEAYLRFTPKAQRTSQELSELLMRPDIDLSKLKRVKIAEEAANLVTQRRAELAGALTAGALTEKEDAKPD